MPLLRVDLQEGFDDDVVAARLDEGEEQRKEGVTTMEQVGYAGSIEFHVGPGPARLHVSVPTRALSNTIDLDVSGDLYVGVAVPDNAIEFHISSEPLGYL
jgi:hypothetical protein